MLHYKLHLIERPSPTRESLRSPVERVSGGFFPLSLPPRKERGARPGMWGNSFFPNLRKTFLPAGRPVCGPYGA